MKYIFFVLALISNFNLLAQNFSDPLRVECQKKVIEAIKHDKNSREINSNTKIVRILDGYIKCSNKQFASYDISYLDSLMISDSSSYWAYNYSENKGCTVVAYFNFELGSGLLFGNETVMLNNISKFYDLDKVVLLSLVGVGYCFIYDDQIWIADGNIRTDLSTYLREKYSLIEFRNDFLLRIASPGDIPFLKR